MKKVIVNAQYGVNESVANKMSDWQQNSTAYTVTVKYSGKQMTLPFFMGSALTHDPSENDVLPCLVSDYQAVQHAESFEEFADEFGYDVDSRTAEATYKQCQKIARNMQRVFGDDLENIITKYQDM